MDYLASVIFSYSIRNVSGSGIYESVLYTHTLLKLFSAFGHLLYYLLIIRSITLIVFIGIA